jgi:hypothetical protein
METLFYYGLCVRRFGSSDSIYSFAQYIFVYMSRCCDPASGTIGSFLNQMAHMAASPFPNNFMPRRCLIQTAPPVEICFPAKATTHCFYNVARVREQMDLTGLAQRLQAQRSRHDFRLLIGRVTEVFTDCAPDTFVPEQSHCSRARGGLAITQAGSIAKDRDLLVVLSVFLCHSGLVAYHNRDSVSDTLESGLAFGLWFLVFGCRRTLRAKI